MAVTGIVCGSVSLGISILLLILVLVVGASILGFMKTVADEVQKQQQNQGGGGTSGDEGSMIEPMMQSVQCARCMPGITSCCFQGSCNQPQRERVSIVLSFVRFQCRDDDEYQIHDQHGR